MQDLHLEVCADAVFGNVENKTKSTEGAIIRFRGEGARRTVIYCRWKKISRVCKSVKSAEALAMEDTIDTAN